MKTWNKNLLWKKSSLIQIYYKKERKIQYLHQKLKHLHKNAPKKKYYQIKRKKKQSYRKSYSSLKDEKFQKLKKKMWNHLPKLKKIQKNKFYKKIKNYRNKMFNIHNQQDPNQNLGCYTTMKKVKRQNQIIVIIRIIIIPKMTIVHRKKVKIMKDWIIYNIYHKVMTLWRVEKPLQKKLTQHKLMNNKYKIYAIQLVNC